MNRSLSVLLPVCNAQSFLEQSIVALLEILPELTADFEVLIIDDGSSDDTADTAQQLVARYPQLRLIRHQRRLGGETAIEAGLAIAQGDVVFLRDAQSKFDLCEIGKLWRRMDRRHFVQARAESALVPASSRTAARSAAPSSWERAVARSASSAVVATASRATATGFKMFLRSLGRDLPWSISDPDAFIAELTARGYDCEEIVVRSQESGFSPTHQVAADRQPAETKQKPRRPNYLARILALAAGN